MKKETIKYNYKFKENQKIFFINNVPYTEKNGAILERTWYDTFSTKNMWSYNNLKINVIFYIFIIIII